MGKIHRVLCETQAVIVGGGIMGSATAYYLARAGVAVVLLEKATQVGQEASGVNAGGVRQHDRDAAEMPLAIAAIKMWKTLSDELDFDLEYRQGGHLRLASSPDEYSALAESVASQHGLGLHDIYLIDEKEVRKLVPELGVKCVGASYCPSDGHANPHRACPAFAKAAKRLGAIIHVKTEATQIDVLGHRKFVVHTPEGQIRTDYVVNAAGAWAGNVAKMVGIADIAVRPGYWQSMVTEPVPPFLRPVLTWPKASSDSLAWRNFNVKQLEHGELLISGAWTGKGNPQTAERLTEYEGVTGSARDFIQVFPHLKGIALQRAWVGIDGHPPDNVVCMGPSKDVEGYLFAGPGSGHGFALGPIIGKLLAELITVGKCSMPIAALAVERLRMAKGLVA